METNKLVDFFINAQPNVVQLETLEISHPAFSRVFYLVRNHTDGFEGKTESGQTVFFQYCPLKIEVQGIKDDLDQIISVTLGDLGEMIPSEIQKVRELEAFTIRPQVIYRTYRSDDFNNVLYGPAVLEIVDISMNREGATFEAKAPSLNINATGELYKLDRFPMLRGFL